MKKKYKCRLSASSLLVTVKGKVIRLELEPDVVNEFGLHGCSYTTDNKDIQHAIEHSKRFNSAQKEGIWTDDKEPEKEEPSVQIQEGGTKVEEKAIEEKPKVVRRGRAKKEV